MTTHKETSNDKKYKWAGVGIEELVDDIIALGTDHPNGAFPDGKKPDGKYAVQSAAEAAQSITQLLESAYKEGELNGQVIVAGTLNIELRKCSYGHLPYKCRWGHQTHRLDKQFATHSKTPKEGK